MSSNNRAASKGSKAPKGDKAHHKTDKADGRGGGEKQHAALTGGGGGDTKSNEYKIKQLMELTQRTENQVCLALYDCDYDVERAIHMLLDSPVEDEWETTVKKRKNRQQSASKGEQKADSSTATSGGGGGGNADDWNDSAVNSGAGGEKDKSRRVGGSQKFQGSRGWRGREKQENERNLEDGSGAGGRERRGRPGGSMRGSGGSRGRGGGRAGGRFPARNRGGTFNNRPMETWDNSWDAAATGSSSNAAEEGWDEFPGADEWCGTETKVFTPSQPVETAPMTNLAAIEPSQLETAGSVGGMDNTTPLGATVQQSMDMLAQISAAPPVALTGTLNAAQSQYFTQLTQQSNNTDMNKYGVVPAGTQPTYANSNNANYPPAQPAAPPPSTYGNAYAVAATGDVVPVQLQQHPPARTKVQRAKLPPPSKIPATAVEMPGDLNTNMGLLDLQFGVMDIISESASFDGAAAAAAAVATGSLLDASAASATIDLNNQAPPSVTMDAYSPSKPSAQSSISSALSQSLSNSDSIPQTSGEHYSAAGGGGGGAGSQRSSVAAVVSSSSLDQLNKHADTQHAYSQATSYSSYPSKSASYPNQAYSSSANYSSTQTTNSYVANQGPSYVSSETAVAYNSSGASNSYQNAYATQNSSAYPSNSSNAPFPGATYPPANQTYQPNASQSVYGTNAGLSNATSNYSGGGVPTQYNSYTSNQKLSGSGTGQSAKDATSNYDSNTTGSINLSTTASSTASATPMSLASTVAATKSSATSSKNSNSVVSNIPPSAAPVVGQYMVPYFHSQMYSYEDMQMIQQRIPHMTTPFYEMSYQTPATSLGREGSYSLSTDGRYARTDSNASPVSSTQSSTQPMIAAQTAAGPYFFAPYSAMTPGYPFSAVYTPQLPTGTNAHASNTSAQYAKPTSYGSGYSSGYDALGQSQDYAKGGYVGNTQAASKGTPANATAASNAGNDLSGMYGKSHTALGKVNGFHSGTPPPYTGTLGQSALAPSGTGYGPQMYIPTLAHQQHHSTQLMHQPLHQMEVRHHGRRMDSGNSSGPRAQQNNQQKTGSKQTYPTSYWNQS